MPLNTEQTSLAAGTYAAVDADINTGINLDTHFNNIVVASQEVSRLYDEALETLSSLKERKGILEFLRIKILDKKQFQPQSYG